MLNNDKNSIINRLKELQTQQTTIQNEQNELIQQLKNLTLDHTTLETTNNNTEEYQDPDEFQIGETVRILNPGRFQEKSGTICNLGTTRVTVLTKKGRKIIRAPFNLRKEPKTKT